jgi:hypothetical protein
MGAMTCRVDGFSAGRSDMRPGRRIIGSRLVIAPMGRSYKGGLRSAAACQAMCSPMKLAMK